MSKANDRPLLEAVMEGAEAAYDLAVDNEAVKAVPIVGTAFKILKGLDDFRSRVLQKKLFIFLSEPRLKASVEARALRQRMIGNDEKNSEIGEMLFLVLEKMTDNIKPVLLARAYASYLDDVIDSITFEAIAHVIDTAFYRDLLSYLTSGRTIENHVDLWHQRIASAGLEDVSEESWEGNRTYQDTPLGHIFKLAIKYDEIRL
jgi:hypothetical protein